MKMKLLGIILMLLCYGIATSMFIISGSEEGLAVVFPLSVGGYGLLVGTGILINLIQMHTGDRRKEPDETG